MNDGTFPQLHALSVALEYRCYRAAMWMVDTPEVLDPMKLRTAIAPDRLLEEFVSNPPPQYGVLQNAIVELVRRGHCRVCCRRDTGALS